MIARLILTKVYFWQYFPEYGGFKHRDKVNIKLQFSQARIVDTFDICFLNNRK